MEVAAERCNSERVWPRLNASAEIGYEFKFTDGLVKLQQKTLVTSTNGTSTKENSSALHLEWGASKPFSFAADYNTKQQPSGEETDSKIAGKLAVSQKVDVGFNLQKKQVSGQPAVKRSDITLNASLGSKAAPLKVTGKLVNFTQGKKASELKEVGFQGNVGKPKAGLKFSGGVKQQQGDLDGKPGGKLEKLQIEANLTPVKLISAKETFVPEKGKVKEKDRVEAWVTISPTTEAFWLRQRETFGKTTGREEIGLSQKLKALEVSAGHESKNSAQPEKMNETRLRWCFVQSRISRTGRNRSKG